MKKNIALTTDDLDSLLGEVAERYMQQLAGGQQPDIERYAKDHPEIASSIRQTFPALKVCNQPLTEINRKQLPDLSNAKQLGDFLLLHQLGSGGMGVVYEAEQVSMGRHVALKILPMAGTAAETVAAVSQRSPPPRQCSITPISSRSIRSAKNGASISMRCN